MCDPFTITFLSAADQVFAKISTDVTAAGGQIDGASNAGSFEISTVIGDFRGDYVFDVQQIEVIITHKPFLISCSRIEEEVRKRLEVL